MYTLKQCKEHTMQMWKWLAENPYRDKLDFLDTHPEFPQDLYSDCGCCEYTWRNKEHIVESNIYDEGTCDTYESVDCSQCCIKWPCTLSSEEIEYIGRHKDGIPIENYCGNSYFEAWCIAQEDGDIENTIKYATIIYELACGIDTGEE